MVNELRYKCMAVHWGMIEHFSPAKESVVYSIVNTLRWALRNAEVLNGITGAK